MEELDLEKALDRLQHQEAFQFILGYLREMHEELLDELPDIPADKLQQHAGRITSYRDILAIISPR